MLKLRRTNKRTRSQHRAHAGFQVKLFYLYSRNLKCRVGLDHTLLSQQVHVCILVKKCIPVRKHFYTVRTVGLWSWVCGITQSLQLLNWVDSALFTQCNFTYTMVILQTDRKNCYKQMLYTSFVVWMIFFLHLQMVNVYFPPNPFVTKSCKLWQQQQRNGHKSHFPRLIYFLLVYLSIRSLDHREDWTWTILYVYHWDSLLYPQKSRILWNH